MNLFTLLQDPYYRIKSAHIVAISLLLFNALFFTDNTLSIFIQLIIALIILLHHIDDSTIKNSLINVQSNLREDKNIFDNNVIVSETDLDGVITYVNQNYLNITGYQESELVGNTHALIRSQDTDKSLYRELYSRLNEGKTFIGVFKNIRKDKRVFWVNTHITPRIVNNQKVGYKAIMFDITDKVLDKEILQNNIQAKDIKLQEQSTRFEFAINSSRDGFWDYDLIKKEFYLSDGWRERLGFEKDQTINYLDYLSLVPDEYRFEHHHAMHDILETSPDDLRYIHFRIRYPIVTLNGEKLKIEDVGNVFFDKDQTPIRITGFHRDITEQERQSKIIESQNRVAAMGEVISNIAHQWRQPIGAINNTLNDLEFDIELEDMSSIDAKVFLNTSSKIKEYTSFLSQTINDFRELTSNEKVKSTFLVEQCLKKAYSISQTEYEKHSINFGLIESGEKISELYGYDRELQQVLLNIFNNAKDILIEKKISNPEVISSVITSDNDVTIIIHDNAGGIHESIISKVFDPYFTTKHESLGTGIGLYMSKKIITEYFNGTIKVENENNGAKFIITLPKEI